MTRPVRRRASHALIWWGAGFAGLALVLAIALSATSDSSSSEAAHDFALPNFAGETVRLSDFRGQGLVVNYWASWCLPCLAELPGFEQVYQRHRGEVGFLGVNLADDPASASSVVTDTGITYPLAIDIDGATYAAFGAFAMPTTVFVAPNGEVLELHSGDLTAAELEDKIAVFFGESG